MVRSGCGVITEVSRARAEWTIVFLCVWFVAAVGASASGLLDNIPSPILLVAGFVIPLAGFSGAYFYSDEFRRFVLAQDLRQLTFLQASRITGFIFFVEYMRGNLPAAFAIPTGLSDVTIGSTALIAVSRLVSRDGVPKRGFILWHRFGVFALLVSGGTGILTSPTPLGIFASDVTSQAMSRFPLSLVPTFLGPVVLILHLMALAIAHEQGRSRVKL